MAAADSAVGRSYVVTFVTVFLNIEKLKEKYVSTAFSRVSREQNRTTTENEERERERKIVHFFDLFFSKRFQANRKREREREQKVIQFLEKKSRRAQTRKDTQNAPVIHLPFRVDFLPPGR